MQIYVCVKHVPDSAAHIAIVDHTHIDDNVNFLLNPYDEHAITEATRIKENLPGSQVIAICLGRNDAENTLRSAMAMGADRSILIVSENLHDSITTAKILKTAIDQDGNPGLIFTGKESIDCEGMQTQFRIAALFDFPVATNVVRLDVKDDKVTLDTGLSGGGVHTYEMFLPCVIGAGRGLNTPRYPTFPDIVKSKKKPVKKIALTDLSIESSKSSMTIVRLEPLKQSREPKEITGNTQEVAQKIVKILKQEAKVI
jgi:electron transfer flavoprotein beta subunit